MGDDNNTALKILTVNIEGVVANRLYLEKLCSQNNIICLQEHWLWDFQKNWIQNNFNDFKSFVRCHDSNDPITNFNVPRGQSGVAILWSNKLADRITCLDVGNERVMAIELDAEIKICIINVYLPTNKSDSEYRYRECLDVLHDIIQRYELTHKILLCGDLNGTLLPNRNNKHDIILKDFLQEHFLSTGTFSSMEPTFFHFNGVVSSQIDYILSSDSSLYDSYSILQKDPCNVSSHVPIQVDIRLPYGITLEYCSSVPKLKQKPKTVYSWTKISSDSFIEHLQRNMNNISSTNIDEIVTDLTNCLVNAARASVPSKKLWFKGPKRRVPGHILQSLKHVKETYGRWKAAGKPDSGPLLLENKLAKKNLRQQQRMEEVSRRRSFYDSVMENPSSDKFYQLIRRSRSKNESNTPCIQVNNTKHFDPNQQRRCFAQYYEDLATPKDMNFDNVFLELCNIRCNDIEAELNTKSDTVLTISEADVGPAIDKLNNGKSADEYGLSSEHFKAAKPIIVPILTRLFNQILLEKDIPNSFKTGIITPVLKKGKDAKDMGNYRGITVSSTFGKLFEYSLLSKLNLPQSDHQFGFTSGLSPVMAGLLVSEAKSEAIQNRHPLFLATLDSQNAFDTVHHKILLDKLFQTNIHKDIWTTIKNLYSGITSKVKWLGECSDSFPVNQGVKQGGILSTHLYKTYIDPLLKILRSKRLGFYLGTVYIGVPTVADDLAYLSKFKDELQLMLNEAEGFSGRNRFQIHPVKTQVVSLPNIHTNNNDLKWTLGENVLSLKENTVHLGLIRSGKKESELNIKERISLARRTSYSLINTGLHGTNGLNPQTSYVIYKAYVIPRLLYGLEIISLSKSQLSELERYHLNTLRQIQSLPKRTASASVYMLLGALPIEAELQKRQSSLLHSVLTSENQCLQEVVQRQLAFSFDNAHSFFYITSQVLEKYQLPSISQILISNLSKLKWKHTYKKSHRVILDKILC